MLNWFKKQNNDACESCGIDLSSVLIFKKGFAGFPIIAKQIVENVSPTQIIDQNYINNLFNIRPLLTITSVTNASAGSVFVYDLNLKSSPHNFCSSRCATLYSKKSNLVFLFNDTDNKCQKRVVCPENEIANAQLGNVIAPFRGLFVPKPVTDFLAPSVNIITQELVLRDLEKLDLKGLWNIYSDKETMTLFDPETAQKSVTQDEWAKGMIKNFIEGNSYYWVISFSAQPDTVLGFCYLRTNDIGVTIEFAINKVVRGRGIMTNALLSLIPFLKQQGIKELKAVSEPGNIGSSRVLQKIGFKQSIAPVLSNSGNISLKRTYSLSL